MLILALHQGKCASCKCASCLGHEGDVGALMWQRQTLLETISQGISISVLDGLTQRCDHLLVVAIFDTGEETANKSLGKYYVIVKGLPAEILESLVSNLLHKQLSATETQHVTNVILWPRCVLIQARNEFGEIQDADVEHVLASPRRRSSLHIPFLETQIDPGDSPCEHAVVQGFGKSVTSVVGLSDGEGHLDHAAHV